MKNRGGTSFPTRRTLAEGGGASVEFAILLPVISLLLVTILGLGPTWILGLRAQVVAEHLTWREVGREDSWISGSSVALTSATWSLPEQITLSVGPATSGGHPDTRLNAAYGIAPAMVAARVVDPLLKKGIGIPLGVPALSCDDTLIKGEVVWPWQGPGWEKPIKMNRSLYLRAGPCTTEEMFGRATMLGAEGSFAAWEVNILK